MADPPPVDTDTIVREVEAEVARRRAAGEYPTRLLEALHVEFSIPDDNQPPELLAVLNTARPVTADRRPQRPIIFSKRLIRRLVAWYIRPIAEDQGQFNLAILREFRSLERRLARVETPWSRPTHAAEGEASAFAAGLEEARANAFAPHLSGAPAGPVLVAGDDDSLRAAFHSRGIGTVDPPVGAPRSDPMEQLERSATHSLSGVVLAGILPRLSPAELLRVIPLAARALRTGGVLIADAPNPRHASAPVDPSGVDPGMQRWLSTDTMSLLGEAAGLNDVEVVGLADAGGTPTWCAVVMRNPLSDALDADG